MKVISCSSAKGGTGKTTTALHIATTLAEEGKKVLFIDLDLMGTASTAFEVFGAKFDFQFLPPERVGEFIDEFYDYIFLDLPRITSTKDKVFLALLHRLDVVLMPFKPSLADLWGALEYIDVLKAVNVPTIAAFVAMDEKTIDSRESREIIAARCHLITAGVPKLKALELQDLQNSILHGPAGDRFAPFYNEIKTLL